jgi:hypothetical protein
MTPRSNWSFLLFAAGFFLGSIFGACAGFLTLAILRAGKSDSGEAGHATKCYPRLNDVL